MKKKFTAFLLLLLIATLTFSIRTVYGHTWNQEDRGEAAVDKDYENFGSIGEYDLGTLKLGGDMYGDGYVVSEGAMHVYGYATASGWVTGSINWWQRGRLSGIGIKITTISIQVNFSALDVNENRLVREEVFHKDSRDWFDEGTSRTGYMDIYLTEGHLFRFSLYARVIASGTEVIRAVADFGGLTGYCPDGRIEWGYIAVPNITPVDIWPDVCDCTYTPGVKDGWVDLDDFMTPALPGHIFTRRDEMKPWPDPPGAWGPHCDVDFNRRIGIGDLMAIGIHFGGPWPPPGYGGAQSDIYSEMSLANSSNPQISVYPAIIAAVPNSTFTVDITISNVTDLYGWEFWISFDPSILEVASHNETKQIPGTEPPIYYNETVYHVYEGPLLKTAGDTLWLMNINNTAGTIAVGDMLDPLPSQGATGSGTIANVTFYVQSKGATSLNLTDTELNTVIGDDVIQMSHNATDGYVATTIQAAVDWANTTDTVYVTEGTYHEHVTVNKSLTLRGENVETTTINGNGTGNSILILANNTNISGFTITNGSVGIYLEQTSNTNIVGNKIANNNIGIKPVHSGNNVIHHNNFIDNSFQVKSIDSVNSWDDGSEGNYWSDYTGEDQDGDGIGDTPYVINGQNKDNHPLMDPWSPL